MTEKTLKIHAARIRAALARRDEQDQAIAKELQAAKDEFGHTRLWLAWCHAEFGWNERQAYRRLDPAQMQEKREQDREYQASKRVSESDSAEPRTEPEPAAVVEPEAVRTEPRFDAYKILAEASPEAIERLNGPQDEQHAETLARRLYVTADQLRRHLDDKSLSVDAVRAHVTKTAKICAALLEK